MDFRIDPELKSLIPPLSAEEYGELERSVVREGCRDPLVLWADGTGKPRLLDGHHRLAITRKHGLPFNTVALEFPNKDAARIWILDNQRARRNLPKFALVELHLLKESILRRIAQEHLTASRGRGKKGSRIEKPIQVDDQIAEAAGVGKETVYRVRFLRQHAEENTLDQLRKGLASVNDAYKRTRRVVRSAQNRQRLLEGGKRVLPSGVRLVCGDALKELQKIPDSSFEAIITDPPYGVGFDYDGEREQHSDPLAYGRWLKPIIAQMNRVLRPGGFLAVFQSGRYFRHLWDWFGVDIIIYAHCRDFVQIRSTMPINFGFDPVVIQYKPGGEPLRPTKPERNLNYYVAHTSGQVSDQDSLAVAHPCPRPLDAVEELVKNFVVEGGAVLDPFCGSGTTGVACVRLGRAFTGIDNKREYIRLARRRIADASSTEGME